MIAVMRAEIYKLIHYKLLWCMPVLFIAMGCICARIEYKEFYMYNELEFFSCPDSISLYMGFIIVLIIGYTAGADFSYGTIKNILTVGIRRKNYYFARLIVQFILTALLIILSMGVNCVYRLIDSNKYLNYPMKLFAVKFIVYIGIVLLQYFVIVAFVYMISYFLKSQFISVIAGLFVLYGEIVIRALFELNDIDLSANVLNYTPVTVLQNMLTYVVNDRILELDFLKYGISAGIMIIVFVLIGYMRFKFDNCVEE